MKELINSKLIYLAIIISILATVIYVSSIILSAQSQEATVPPVSVPPSLTEGPVPGGLIRGIVSDENGNLVSGATVTLWQNGEMWQHGEYEFVPGDNPKTTNIANNNEGSYVFGFVYPGQYTVTAEKDGYRGSASVFVGNETMHQTVVESGDPADIVMANITLVGYYMPTLSPEQLSRTGAIMGTIRSAGTTSVRVADVNVSLWQNGQMVIMPDNPQASSSRDFSGKSVDYLFEHLAPGQYQVRAEYSIPPPESYNDTVAVDLGYGTVTADIVLSHVYSHPILSTPSPTPPPDTIPVTSGSPSQPSTTTEPKPIPAIPGMLVLSVIVLVTCFMHRT